jgi:NAD+ synthase (glutamine-hydrolysing)
LTEIALGWCTYNGDQQSHYHVNAGVPKSMVRELVRHRAAKPEYAKARKTLEAVLGTVISPELTKTGPDGISQSTEAILGDFDLHEFFLTQFVRWGDTPAKVRYLTKHAFEDTYSQKEIDRALKIFLQRFPAAQVKRTNMPEGPKVGTISLSPRGDWRMPSDLINPALWSVI